VLENGSPSAVGVGGTIRENSVPNFQSKMRLKMLQDQKTELTDGHSRWFYFGQYDPIQLGG
jgi:hypothetical protein